MKNHETTLKNHGNQPKTMENHETTLKKHGNQPKTKKNHETTLRHFHGWQTDLLRKWSFFVTHTQTLHHNIYIIIRWSRSPSNMLLPPTGPRIVHLSVWRHCQRRRSQGNNQQSGEGIDKQADISTIPKGEDHKERSRLHLATSWRDLDLSSARCVKKINKLVEYFLSLVLLLVSPPVS